MRSGIATVPLDWGRCPRWLFERMKRLARGIFVAMREEFGQEEILRRLADPVWFQSLGCVLGFDWNSSGLTTTTLAALKEGIKGLEKELGIFICGGKGKTSRKTPEEIQRWGERLGFSQEKIQTFVKASKLAAKVDTSCVQDGFQIYHHSFIFTKQGQWAVVQQGMNTVFQKARRYHWLSKNLSDFTLNPHSGIISDVRVKALNLTHKDSSQNKKVITQIVNAPPKSTLKDLKLILEKKNSFYSQPRLSLFSEIELPDVEFNWHPVVVEKFDLKRLEKTILKICERKPKNFTEFISLEGVGPKTTRALSLVAEIIYGAGPSFEDPARYTFAHGGKDGTPYPVDRVTYDKTIEILERGIRLSRLSQKEKVLTQKRVYKTFGV